LYSFKGGSDGSKPTGGLLDVKGTLYGTTEGGGRYGSSTGFGTIFSITADGHERVLYRFKRTGGQSPQNSGLIRVGKKLYGVTANGGTAYCHCGTVFAITTSGVERTLYNFKGGSDGYQPAASLRYVGGRLYGVTSSGGLDDLGTVFEVSLSGKERVLRAFTGGTDGDGPSAALINVNGTLYGTTSSGGGAPWCNAVFGSLGCGIVYSISTSGKERVIYRFKGGRDGADPLDALVDVNGFLYGTTYFGGFPNGRGCCGTVFRIELSSGKEQIIYRFKGGTDGFLPLAGLLVYRGMLYGTTAFGGTGIGYCSVGDQYHCGTIYQVSTSGTETILHSFRGSDGNRPWTGRLVQVDGKLYGATALGGTHCHPVYGCGTVFEVTP
jgi:uncharacterized repeat protein (TIGR03803 family)